MPAVASTTVPPVSRSSAGSCVAFTSELDGENTPIVLGSEVFALFDRSSEPFAASNCSRRTIPPAAQVYLACCLSRSLGGCFSRCLGGCLGGWWGRCPHLVHVHSPTTALSMPAVASTTVPPVSRSSVGRCVAFTSELDGENAPIVLCSELCALFDRSSEPFAASNCSRRTIPPAAQVCLTTGLDKPGLLDLVGALGLLVVDVDRPIDGERLGTLGGGFLFEKSIRGSLRDRVLLGKDRRRGSKLDCVQGQQHGDGELHCVHCSKVRE